MLLKKCDFTHIMKGRVKILETYPKSEENTGMLLLTKMKHPLKFKMLCGFNKHAVKLRMHKAVPYTFPIHLNTF